MFNLRRVYRFNALIFVFCVSASSAAGAASWISMGGPLGGLGYDVRIHPNNKNVMYVTDNFAGVFKSDDAGQTWHATNSGITTRGGTSGDAISIFSLTIDPNNPNIVWAGTFGDGDTFGVFKSTDAGLTWTMKTNGMTLGNDIAMVFRGFTIQQGNSNVVYAQAEIPTTVQGWGFNRVKGRIYKTTNGGDSWNLIWQGDDLARYVIIDPTNPSVLYASHGIFDREASNSDCANGVRGGVGVLKSTDGGMAWTAVNNGITDLYVGSLRMHPSNPQILFAASGNNACSQDTIDNQIVFSGGLFKTTNGGASWSKVISREIMNTVNFSPSNPDIVYAGSSFAFYRSDDGGESWSKLTRSGIAEGTPGWGPPGIQAGFPIDVVVDPDSPNTIYANNYAGGVFRSLDGAATWAAWSKGYSGAEIQAIFAPSSSSTVFAVSKGIPFVSANYGADWNGLAYGDAAIGNYMWYSIVALPTDPDVILMSDQGAGIIFRSIDGGNTSNVAVTHPDAQASNPTKMQGFKSMAFAPSNPEVVYAGVAKNWGAYLSSSPTGTVIYKSTDAGATFTPMPSIIDGNNVTRLIVHSTNSNMVYAATTNGVYKSTDGAVSWVYFSSLGNRKIEALAVGAGYLIAAEVEGGIMISTNDGATWTGPHNTGFNSPNPYITAIALDPANPNVVYAADLYSGVYRSADTGLTWSPFPDSFMSGLTIRAVKDLVLNRDVGVMYAATQGGGVFRYDLQAITGLSDSDRLFNWAETTYSQYFQPTGMSSQTGYGYYYRYYSQTNTYVASMNNRIYIYGPSLWGADIIDLGALADWLPLAQAAGF